MPFVQAKCPNCGGILSVDNSHEAALCPFCNTPYIVEKAINSYHISNNITAGTVNIFGGNSSDFDIRAGTLVKYNGAATEVVIPDGISGIGNRVFEGCRGLTSITIPNGVTYIGEHAFYGCTGLKSVSIPSSVKKIGEDAFGFCNEIKTAGPIGGGYDFEFGWMTSIPDYAFSYCNGLTSVTIPSGVKYIGYRAFFGCALTNITIPDSVTRIGDSAFKWCFRLTSVTIGSGVTNIGQEAFSGCKVLTQINYNARIVEDVPSDAFVDAGEDGSGISVLFGDTVERIPSKLFFGYEEEHRPNVRSVTISDSVTSIGNYAFYRCYNLTSVTIGSGVTNIGKEAFSQCPHLTSITIPSSVRSIGKDAFAGCFELRNVSVDRRLDLDAAFGGTAFLIEDRKRRKVCTVCGGEFQGVFTKKCRNCGQTKKY